MKRRTSMYATMTAGDLARITRERGLEKPDVLSLSDWADWLEEQDHPAVVEAVEAEVQNNSPAEEKSYGNMSNTALRKLAKERGINLHDRDEIIDALQAADGMTEDEQAQMGAGADEEAS